VKALTEIIYQRQSPNINQFRERQFRKNMPNIRPGTTDPVKQRHGEDNCQGQAVVLTLTCCTLSTVPVSAAVEHKVLC
jgi:hypothetical protein